MSALALSKAKQKYFFTSDIDAKKKLRDFADHFTRFDLELRELKTQSKEFQKLAAKLFSEGHLSTSKEVLRRKDSIIVRMCELQGILSTVN